jgi:hypothetical protein
LKEEELPVKPLFSEEKDTVRLLIKRILYAEGDHLKIDEKSVTYLKKVLFSILTLFEVDNNLKSGK